MGFLEKINHALNNALIWIAGGFLLVMILLTCANVFLRVVWTPVRGTFELMGYFGAIITAFALAYTQLNRGHIAVDILVLRFSKKAQRILSGINNFLCMIFFALVTWQIAKYATTLLTTGEVTETLRIVYYPFTYGVALGCAIFSFVFLTDFLKSFIPEEEEEV
jgi:TRAP-type C4-dicarboxylate transport system permease small subunit